MRISPLTHTIASEIKKAENARKVDNTEPKRVSHVDKSEFSSDAQRLSETREKADVLLQKVSSEPEIREEKIAEVKEKINNGFYDSPEFINNLADKLIKDLGIDT